jgi:hypothetical protein
MDSGVGGVDGVQRDIDSSNQSLRDDIDVLHSSGCEVEERIDPDGCVRAMLNGEDGSLDVATGLRVEEDWVPVFAGPGTLGLGAKERRESGEGRCDLEVEAIGDVNRCEGRGCGHW